MEFKVNEYLSAKLVEGKVQIYVRDKYASMCTYVKTDIEATEMIELTEMEPLDDAVERIRADKGLNALKIEISPEDEFWAICSNMQVWAEHDYDTRLLSLTISFSLLKRLADVGDPIAQKAFKKEIFKRLQSDSKNVIRYLISQTLISVLEPEDFKIICFNEDGSPKLVFLEIFKEEADDSVTHFNESIYTNIFRYLEKDQIYSYCVDDSHNYREWLHKLISRKDYSHSGIKVVKALLRYGIEEAKSIISQQILNNKIRIHDLSLYNDEDFVSFFSNYSKAELTSLLFDKNGNRYDWLTKLLKYDKDAYEKGYPVLLAAYHNGIESIKPTLIEELNTGNKALFHYMVHSDNKSIFTLEELERLCYDDTGQMKPWLIQYLDIQYEEMTYGFSFIHYVIKKGLERGKKEIIERIESGHQYTDRLLQRRYFDFMDKNEIKHFFFIDEDTKNYSPWFQKIMDEQTMKLEEIMAIIKFLIEQGFERAKETVKYYLNHEYKQMIYLYNIKGFKDLFTEEEKADILPYSSVKIYWDSQNRKQFKINEYITLKLEENATKNKLRRNLESLVVNIYINGERFDKCRALALLHQGNEGEKKAKEQIESIESIDVLTEGKRRWTPQDYISLTAEDAFWGYCSNMQVWAEHQYDTTLLQYESSFWMLKQLCEAGDPIAKEVVEKEVVKQLNRDNSRVRQFFLDNNFMDMFSDEKIKEFLGTDFVRIRNPESYYPVLLYPLKGDELDLESAMFRTFDQVERLIKIESLKSLKIGLSERIYHEMLDDLQEDVDFITSLNGLSQLPYLEELQVNRAILKNIGDSEPLPKLKKLTILSSRVADLSGIEGYKNLTYLDLRDNEIGNIKCLGTLMSLEILLLGENGVANLEPLANLKKLTELDLHDTSVKTLEPLNKLSNLTILDCSKCLLTRIEDLGNLANLKTLNLRNNKINEIQGLDKLKNLERLDLRDNTITEIKGLEKLPNLKVLLLSGNDISEIKGLDTLVNLESLDLQKNNITEIKGLDNLQNLKHLMLSVNPISEIKGLERLANLEILSLNSSDMEHDVYEYFSEFADVSNADGKRIQEIKGLDQLVNLRELYMTGQSITKIKGLDNLKNLESINLMWNTITEIKGLDKLSNLQDLYLSFNQITEIKGLEHNPKLKELYLGHNNITTLQGLGHLLKLTNVNFNGTPLKKTIQTTIDKEDYTPQDLVVYCQEKEKRS